MDKLTNGFTVQSHFEGKDPIVRHIYDQLLKTVSKFGRVVEEPKKTSIHLVNVSAFAGSGLAKECDRLNYKEQS